MRPVQSIGARTPREVASDAGGARFKGPHPTPVPLEALLSEMPDSVRVALEGLRSLGGDDLVRQMIAVFLEYSAGRVVVLKAAAGADDPHGASEAAHALKGSARQLGLDALADACLAVEIAGRNGNAAATKTLTAAVQDCYTTAAEWLETLRA